MPELDICPELTAFDRASTERTWVANVVAPEIGGGRATRDDVDALHAHPHATGVAVSGLDQDTFEYFVTEHGRRFTHLRLWKCPRITDLSPLQDLPGLEVLSLYWNQRAHALWDLRATPRLRALSLLDMRHVHDLTPLADCTSLRELHLGDAVDDVSTYATLEPLAGLAALRGLWLVPKAVTDARIQPLAGLTGLQALRCSARLLTFEQFAWLRAHLGDHVRSDALDGVVRVNRASPERDVMVVGRRKPFLSSDTQGARVAKAQADWAALVARYRADPDRQP